MKKKPLLPQRHPQQDFFISDLFDGLAFKSDVASMEHPMFTLSMQKDSREINYTSPDGTVNISVIPSARYGLPTIFDKDVLLYSGSMIMQSINKGNTPSRTVQFSCYDLLVATNRNTGGLGYEGLKNAFRRLKGVNIETNIGTSDGETTKGFGLIESYDLIKSDKAKGRMVAVKVTLSEWFYNLLLTKNVLTINKDYFRLRKAIDRRLYEIARKHCGNQKKWSISLETLQRKTGSTTELRKFRYAINELIKENHLPDYEVSLNKSDIVTFTPKHKLSEHGVEIVEKDKTQQQSEASTSGLSPETLAKGFTMVKEAETGWDYDVIQQEFFDWSKKREKPNNLEAAFLGFVRRKVKNAPGFAKIKSSDTVEQEQGRNAEEEKQEEVHKRKEIEDFLKNKNDDYRGLVEILLRYYPVSYCRNMLLTRRDEPIQIRKHDAHVSCEINGLYIGRDLPSILKDLEEFFDCAVDLTIDDSREMSESLIYTGSFEELEEEMNSANIFATKQDDIA
jgi:plasmid replication initiation protein